MNLKLLMFKGFLELGYCPFCEKKLSKYYGSLGYESMNCDDCGLMVDENGISIKEVTQ